MKSTRLWTVLVLLSLTLIVLLRRGDKDRTPPSAPLDQFPATLGPWSGADVLIDPAVLEVMGQGIFLNRLYTPVAAGPSGPVALFIAFFPTQRTGQSIHSPQNCLPGAGWTFEQSGTTRIEPQSGAGPTHTVGEYIITDGNSRSEVLYWYQSHGRTIASDYRAKLSMIASSIRYNRSDAGLVRVVTPIEHGESDLQAHLRAVAFTQQLLPDLSNYIPD